MSADWGNYAVPALIAISVFCASVRRVPAYEAFVEGAMEGLRTVVKIFPYLAAVLLAISILRASGLMEAVTSLLAPAAQRIGLPPEVLPLSLMRPLSGSGALGMLKDLYRTYGVDSAPALLGSIIMGSSDTVFYTLGLYFSYAGIKRTRYALPGALLAWLGGIIGSVLCFKLFF